MAQQASYKQQQNMQGVKRSFQPRTAYREAPPPCKKQKRTILGLAPDEWTAVKLEDLITDDSFTVERIQKLSESDRRFLFSRLRSHIGQDWRDVSGGSGSRYPSREQYTQLAPEYRALVPPSVRKQLERADGLQLIQGPTTADLSFDLPGRSSAETLQCLVNNPFCSVELIEQAMSDSDKRILLSLLRATRGSGWPRVVPSGVTYPTVEQFQQLEPEYRALIPPTIRASQYFIPANLSFDLAGESPAAKLEILVGDGSLTAERLAQMKEMDKQILLTMLQQSEHGKDWIGGGSSNDVDRYPTAAQFALLEPEFRALIPPSVRARYSKPMGLSFPLAGRSTADKLENLVKNPFCTVECIMKLIVRDKPILVSMLRSVHGQDWPRHGDETHPTAAQFAQLAPEYQALVPPGLQTGLSFYLFGHSTAEKLQALVKDDSLTVEVIEQMTDSDTSILLNMLRREHGASLA